MAHFHIWSKGFILSWFVVFVSLFISVFEGTASAASLHPAQRAVQQAPGFADTWNNIHPFLMFDGHVTRPAAIAPRYDFISGAKYYNISAYRSTNPNIFLTYYMPFNRDNGTFTNSLALLSLSQWQALHPDWILYKCDRVTPAYEYGNPNVPLDFTNPALVTWQIQTYAQQASQMGYNAITADNVNMENLFGACGTYQNGQWVQRYSGNYDDPQWRADVVTWLGMMQAALHSLPQPLALIPNFSFAPGFPLSDPSMQGALNNVDGIVDESGFTHFGTGDITDQYWTDRIQFSELVQSLGKTIYIINDFSKVNRAAVQWALASYLMTKEHGCELYISPTQSYGTASWYKEYSAQVGSPTDAMYQAQNVYFRDYTNGVSIVNPSSQYTYTVSLNSSLHYVDLYGNAMGSTVTLAPHSGIVLLISGQSSSSTRRGMHA